MYESHLNLYKKSHINSNSFYLRTTNPFCWFETDTSEPESENSDEDEDEDGDDSKILDDELEEDEDGEDIRMLEVGGDEDGEIKGFKPVAEERSIHFVIIIQGLEKKKSTN